ncbi:phosphoribosylanthranilate isomerase [Flavobacterium sp.]|uniref:phosphoribosylanthranilate isomerase n=1 Tax=Flavobacterium sp. TaxID=239 RepID=UPI0025FC6052|nr:phosphoribosylanthranilate isomerase [Flavobacterium sp.]
MKFSENIAEISLLNPDYLGFIFYEKSERYCNNDIQNVDSSIQKVGVFVNASFEEIEKKVQQYHLNLVQLHGEENPELCAKIEGNLVNVIKAFSVDNKFNFNDLDNYKNFCSYFLFDTKGNQYGGNGVLFDWTILEKYTLDKPYFLSGGIGLENVDQVKVFIKKEYAKNCFAIDLNSKFENAPGIKNVKILNEFIQNLKQ